MLPDGSSRIAVPVKPTTGACSVPSRVPVVVDPALLAAYRAADYVVPLGARICRFRVDAPAPEPLVRWLLLHGPAGWLTAFNPGSRSLSILNNLRRHESLWQHLRAEGFEAFPGYASDPAGAWPDETSLLVPGIPIGRLHRLAREFGQIAYLWLEPGQPPRMLEATDDSDARLLGEN